MLGTFTKGFLLSFLIEVTQTYVLLFFTNKKESLNQGILKALVEATGFEPATSASRTQRSTKLSHASMVIYQAIQSYIKMLKMSMAFEKILIILCVLEK